MYIFCMSSRWRGVEVGLGHHKHMHTSVWCSAALDIVRERALLARVLRLTLLMISGSTADVGD